MPQLTQLPFSRNPFFTGREEQLEAIRAALTNRGRAALSGLGGMGKTQTAVEYAYRHQAEYDHVFWVRAEQETELISGYVALAKTLQIPGHQQEDQQAITALMKQWCIAATKLYHRGKGWWCRECTLLLEAQGSDGEITTKIVVP